MVIPIAEVPVYLDAALKALTLHTEARTSFITFVHTFCFVEYALTHIIHSYWLPFLLRHAHVALRFLPQEAYEESAPMSIEPKPDVVTRVFMIFHGISESDEKWAEARTRASQDVQGGLEGRGGHRCREGARCFALPSVGVGRDGGSRLKFLFSCIFCICWSHRTQTCR